MLKLRRVIAVAASTRRRVYSTAATKTKQPKSSTSKTSTAATSAVPADATAETTATAAMAKAAAHAERLRSQLAAAKLAELHALRAECTALGASANASNADARVKADADTVRGRVVELRSQIGVVERELAVLDVDAYRRYHAKEVEAVHMPLLKDLPTNAAWKRLHGDKLVDRMAAYYRLYDDLLPSVASKVEWGVNLVVDYTPLATAAETTTSSETPTHASSAPSVPDTATVRQCARFVPARGNVMQPEDTLQVPHVRLSVDSIGGDEHGAVQGQQRLFTLMLVDVDSPLPARQTMLAEPLWCVANIPATINSDNNAPTPQPLPVTGDTVLAYTPPHPQRGTGYHRYAFLALEQTTSSSPLDIAHMRQQLDAVGHDVRLFLAQNATTLVPRGLVFHRAAWTPAVSTQIYAEGRVAKAKTVLDANAYVPVEDRPVDGGGYVHESSTATVLEDGRIVTMHEPTYGRLVKRDWKAVTRALPKYAAA